MRRGIEFVDLGDVQLERLAKDEGPEKLRNFGRMIQATESLRGAISRILELDLAILLGGECTLALGTLAGLRSRERRGRAGILWMDAHGDFNTPETTPSGFVGGMCLAFACGRGPPLSPTLEDLKPLLEEDAVVHFGSRALDPLERMALSESEITLVSARELRKDPAGFGRSAAKLLSDRCDWCVLHIDLDVIDPGEMPAVNFPESEGISTRDLLLVGRGFKGVERLRAVEFTSYSPLKDTSRESGRRGVEVISQLIG